MSVSPRELLLRRTSVPNPEEHHWDEIRSSELLSSYADLDNLVNSLVFRDVEVIFLGNCRGDEATSTSATVPFPKPSKITYRPPTK